MDKYSLSVCSREEKTPNQLRREGIVPATVYGPEFDKPGLVMSSMSSELGVDFTSQFRITYTPEFSRYWLLYDRRS